MQPTRPTVFYHDPQCQVRGGVVFDRVIEAERHAEKHGAYPRLCLFRDSDVEGLAQLAMSTGGVTLVLDEFDRACNGKNWRAPSVGRLVQESRHLRVDLWGTFRAARNVNEDTIGQADWIAILRHSKAANYDLQSIKFKCGEQFAEAATRLEPHQFVLWEDA